MRAPEHAIPAPPFPRELTWVNVAPLRMDKQRGRPVLVEFWDFCRVNSLRTLPYLTAWHERYAGGRPARDRRPHRRASRPRASTENVVAAVERLGIEYPVVVDERLEIWDFYGNEGWPARYLWDQQGALYSLHYGEGAYQETEREIQALLGRRARRSCRPLRPEDAEGVLLPAQTADQPGAYSGPYEAGGAWAVLEGAGEVVANGRALRASTAPGCYPLVEHAQPHGRACSSSQLGAGVTCHATCFTPGRRSCRVAPVAQQPDEPRRAVVLDDDRGARPVGRRVRRVGEEVRLVDPRAGVHEPRAGPASPLRPDRRAATGPTRCVWPKSTCGAVMPSRRSTSRIPRRPPRRSARARQVAVDRPEPERVERGDRADVAGAERRGADRMARPPVARQRDPGARGRARARR